MIKAKSLGGRGETLTSISKHYGVSMYAIAAANKNMVDIDFLYEGQHLNIPLADKNSLEVYFLKPSETMVASNNMKG